MTENNFQIVSAAISDRGLSEKRPQNEDSFLEMKNVGLYAVADGVGGAQAGDVASQMAVEILGEAFTNLKADGDAEDLMRLAIERANSAINQMSSDLAQLATMATTIVALHISGSIATIGHVGDSRLYRLDSRGSLFRETQDHSVVEEEVRAGRMTAAQAVNHPSRNVISRALGAENSVEIDMKTIMFEPKTSFLLCSDGITRHIQDFEIREILLSNAEPSDICAKMKEICYSRGAEDNLTAVIVKAVENNSVKTPIGNSLIASFDDEATVATARPVVTETNSGDILEDFDEIPTRGLEMPVANISQPAADYSIPAAQNISNDDDEAYLMQEPVSDNRTFQAEADQKIEESIPQITPSEAISPENRIRVETKPEYKNYEPEKKESGIISKILSSLILLAVGAIIGVAGYYFWQTSVVENQPAPVLTPQTNNIPKTSGDKLRYDADANPAKLIQQYVVAPPKDASDFYLLGRAYLVSKQYEDAKKQFLEARNHLKDVTDAEAKTILANDISQGLTISQDKAAQTAFERETNFSKVSETSNPSNTNQQ